ncbi:flagellar basal-body rod protein FlgB [Marivivens niveibacter]|uniref:Flagellar basal body rod protein FlgB n=1 Tax=Marivivens niveibacter TaxID=1930667 RepID=A0A251X2S4_9RHOB|nr:flagellar basal body rod protein FlgB [Marivivens niveibacter]OUD10987.1 flagellar basal-body rod protein FlgB [Marivivens niveibacter]
MTTGLREGLGIHTEALVLRGKRNDLLASNIANAATPGYKARDIDFDSVLASQTQMGGNLRTSADRHMSISTVHGPDQTGYRVPTQPSLDGNTVDMAVEQMEFSENTVRYQTSLELLNRRISGLMNVIRGE